MLGAAATPLNIMQRLKPLMSFLKPIKQHAAAMPLKLHAAAKPLNPCKHHVAATPLR